MGSHSDRLVQFVGVISSASVQKDIVCFPFGSPSCLISRKLTTMTNKAALVVMTTASVGRIKVSQFGMGMRERAEDMDEEVEGQKSCYHYLITA